MNGRIDQAIEIAAIWHDGTYRKGSWRDHGSIFGKSVLVPVMHHLAMVAHGVQQAGWGEAVVAAAYLHDILEDQNKYKQRFVRDELVRLVGAEVADLVDWVSETKVAPDGRSFRWKERKDGYLKKLEQAPLEALAISLSDKWHNLWTMNRSLERGIDIFSDGPSRKGLGADASKQVWFFESVLDIARNRQSPKLRSAIVALEKEFLEFKSRTNWKIS